MKTAVMRLNIDINLYVPEDIILSNKDEKLQKDEIEVPVPEFLQPVADAIYDSIEDHGFKFDSNRKPRFSNVHGGFSMYRTFHYKIGDVLFKLALDVRVSDHHAKPSYLESNQRMLNKMKDIYEEVKNGTADAETLDVYCKQRDWRVEIFVGGKDKYNTSVDSISAMIRILDGRLTKLISKYQKEEQEFKEAEELRKLQEELDRLEEQERNEEHN